MATGNVDASITLSATDRASSVIGRIRGQLGSLEKSASTLARAIGPLGASFGGLLSVAGFAAFFKAAADGLDRLNDLKDATGASIENLSALEDVALRTGTSYESMAAALVKFNKVLTDAKPGEDAALVLKAIGLNAEQLKQIDPAEALRQTAIALARYADDGNKARAVQILFGRSIQEVAPLLKDLAESGELVAKVTTRQAEEAEKFNKQLAAFDKNATDAGRALVSKLLPAMNEFLEKLLAIKKNGGFLPSIGKELQANLNSDRLRVVTAELESIQKTIDRQGATPLLAKRFEALRTEADALLRKNAELSDSLKGFSEGVSPLPPPIDLFAPLEEPPGANDRPSVRVPGKPDARKDPSLTAEQIARLQVEAEEQAAKEAAEAWDFWGDAKIKKAKEFADTLKGMVDNTTTGKLNELTRQYGVLDEAFSKGQISAEIYLDALGQLDEQFGNLTKPVDKAAKEIDKLSVFAEQAAKNIQDALGDTIYDTLTGRFDSIGRKWGELLAKMASQALAANIGETLFGKDLKGGGLLSTAVSWLGSLFFHDGGVVGSGGIARMVPAAAFAGAPRMHSGGVMGLRADERPAILQVGETVLSRSQSRQAAGPPPIVIHDNRTVVVGDIASRAEVAQAIAQSNQEFARQIRQTWSRHGALA